VAIAWSGSNRKERLPSDWYSRRKRVLERDGHACQMETDEGKCLRSATDVDHVIPGDDHSYENLQALCRFHHLRKSGEEGRAAQAPRASKYRKRESHPGAL
jgi:5-methylcytosine-specific restriction enzyme A